MKKTRSKKSRDTVPLKGILHCTYIRGTKRLRSPLCSEVYSISLQQTYMICNSAYEQYVLNRTRLRDFLEMEVAQIILTKVQDLCQLASQKRGPFSDLRFSSLPLLPLLINLCF